MKHVVECLAYTKCSDNACSHYLLIDQNPSGLIEEYSIMKKINFFLCAHSLRKDTAYSSEEQPGGEVT